MRSLQSYVIHSIDRHFNSFCFIFFTLAYLVSLFLFLAFHVLDFVISDVFHDSRYSWTRDLHPVPVQ